MRAEIKSMVYVYRSANETHGRGKTFTSASTPQAEDRTPTAYDPVSPASTVGGMPFCIIHLLFKFLSLLMGQEGVLHLPQRGTHAVMWFSINQLCWQKDCDGQVSSVLHTSVTGMLRMPFQ